MGNFHSKRNKLKTKRSGLLILGNDPIRKPQMILFGSTLQKSYNPIFYGSIKIEDSRSIQDSELDFDALPANIPKSEMRKNGEYFYKEISSKSLRSGTKKLLEIIAMQSNKTDAVIIGFKRKWMKDTDDILTEYVQILNDILCAKLGIIMFCGSERVNWLLDEYISPPTFSDISPKQTISPEIDIWLIMDDGLCILFPYIMSLHSYWKRYKLHLKIVCNINLSSMNMKNKQQLIFGFVHQFEAQNKMKQMIPKSAILIIESYFPVENDVDMLTIKQLMNKFNLLNIYDDEPETIIAHNKVEMNTIETFEKLSGCKLSDIQRSDVITKWLILSEILCKYAGDSALNVISLPIQIKDIKSRTYMALLQMLCDQTKLVPTIFIKGNP